GENLAASATYDQDRKALEGIGESTAAGGLVGFILSAAGSAVGARHQASQKAGRPEESATIIPTETQAAQPQAVPVGINQAELSTSPTTDQPVTNEAPTEGVAPPSPTLQPESVVPAPEPRVSAEPSVIEQMRAEVE